MIKPTAKAYKLAGASVAAAALIGLEYGQYKTEKDLSAVKQSVEQQKVEVVTPTASPSAAVATPTVLVAPTKVLYQYRPVNQTVLPTKAVSK